MSPTWHSVKPVDDSLRSRAQAVLDQKTKPLGSLGQLEDVAVILASVLGQQIQNLKSAVAVFAADHGIAEVGVSAFPQEVTAQMVNNFLTGGAAVNVLARAARAKLLIVDVGVKAEFDGQDALLSRSIAKGTASFLNAKAMSDAQCMQAMGVGREVVDILWSQGCNVFAAGEMGIGNTSSASAIMHAMTQTPIEQCVGRGTGVYDDALCRKVEIIKQACNKHFSHGQADPLGVLASVGGFEIAALSGAFLQAAYREMVIVVDGFITTSAFLVAAKLEPSIVDYAIFAHQSGELGHAKMLEHLQVNPLLSIQMRLGEGSGAALVLPIIQAAANIYLEMASFESAGVSQKS